MRSASSLVPPLKFTAAAAPTPVSPPATTAPTSSHPLTFRQKKLPRHSTSTCLATSLKSAQAVPLQFHARYSARAKTYSYTIVLNRSPLRSRHAWEYPYPLNLERLKSVARLFLGKHDYNPFCHTKEPNGICQITSIRVKTSKDQITILIQGNRFLYKMVRRIVGAMVAYASGRLTRQQIRAALAGKKHRPFLTAPANGLILESVRY